MMKKQEPVSKIEVYQPQGRDCLFGFRFYSKTGEVLLEWSEFAMSATEFLLADGERILGIKSRLHPIHKYHCDLQFIIGRMEA